MSIERVTTKPASDLTRQTEILVANLSPYLQALGNRMSLSREDTADALQEALLAFIKHRGVVREPLRWLTVVLKHECLRLFRLRRTAEVRLEGQNLLTQAALVAFRGPAITQQLIARELLSRLAPRHRRVLWMRFVAGMSWREIAVALGCKTSGAKKALLRALAEARDAISEHRN